MAVNREIPDSLELDELTASRSFVQVGISGKEMFRRPAILLLSESLPQRDRCHRTFRIDW